MGWVKSTVGCLSWVIALVIIVLVFLKILFFDVAVMGHSGMAPTLLRGERVLLNKRGKPELGKVVVCRHPTEDGWVVGRVAAREGMSIESFRNMLRIDDQEVDFESEGSTRFYNPDVDYEQTVSWGLERYGAKPHRIFVDEEGTYQVRPARLNEGELYLLGDNRAYMGQDSRAYGVVDETTCRGTIALRLTPIEGFASNELKHGYVQPID